MRGTCETEERRREQSQAAGAGRSSWRVRAARMVAVVGAGVGGMSLADVSSC
jgi:NADPH-dependent 2,4-dienoyl-CoA reductase/sulfur reductase-like enzyme